MDIIYMEDRAPSGPVHGPVTTEHNGVGSTVRCNVTDCRQGHTWLVSQGEHGLRYRMVGWEPSQCPGHDAHVRWLQHQYAITKQDAEAEAQRRYQRYPSEITRWNVSADQVTGMTQ